MPVNRIEQLNALQLYGMATAWTELTANSPRKTMMPEVWMDKLIEAELADRSIRRLTY